MDAVQKWNYELKAKEIVGILNEHKFDAVYAPTVEDAKKVLIEKLQRRNNRCGRLCNFEFYRYNGRDYSES